MRVLDTIFFIFQARDAIRSLSVTGVNLCVFFFSSRRRHTRLVSDWSSDVCSSDLRQGAKLDPQALVAGCKLASWDFDHFVSATPAFEPFISVRDKSPQMDLSEGFEEIGRASCRERG